MFTATGQEHCLFPRWQVALLDLVVVRVEIVRCRTKSTCIQVTLDIQEGKTSLQRHGG